MPTIIYVFRIWRPCLTGIVPVKVNLHLMLSQMYWKQKLFSQTRKNHEESLVYICCPAATVPFPRSFHWEKWKEGAKEVPQWSKWTNFHNVHIIRRWKALRYRREEKARILNCTTCVNYRWITVIADRDLWAEDTGNSMVSWSHLYLALTLVGPQIAPFVKLSISSILCLYINSLKS